MVHLVTDINECNGENLCEHNCINQNGSYTCSCKHGYMLLTDQRSCKGTEHVLYSLSLF